jgi:hypothetical protein
VKTENVEEENDAGRQKKLKKEKPKGKRSGLIGPHTMKKAEHRGAKAKKEGWRK